MSQFKIQDIRNLEASPSNPSHLSTKVGEMILSSKNISARVENVNTETGEYRLVLQGKLNKDTTKS